MLVDEGSSEEELDSMLELLDVEDGTDVEELLGIEEVEDGGSDEDELLGGGSIGSSPLIVTMTSFTYVLPEERKPPQGVAVQLGDVPRGREPRIPPRGPPLR